MLLVFLEILLFAIVPYILVAAVVPLLLSASKLAPDLEIVSTFRKTIAIYAGCILVAWLGQTSQLTLFAGIYSLIIVLLLVQEVLQTPLGARERRWLWLTVGWFVALLAAPVILSLTTVAQIIMLGVVNVLGSAAIAFVWVMQSELSFVGKGRILGYAGHSLAIFLTTMSFLGWAALAA